MDAHEFQQLDSRLERIEEQTTKIYERVENIHKEHWLLAGRVSVLESQSVDRWGGAKKGLDYFFKAALVVLAAILPPLTGVLYVLLHK